MRNDFDIVVNIMGSFMLFLLGIIIFFVTFIIDKLINQFGNKGKTIDNLTTENDLDAASELSVKAENKAQTLDSNTPLCPLKEEYPNLLIHDTSWKDNWQDLDKILQDRNITSLYHITDESNWESIKNTNCLVSWDYAQRNNLNINMPGGNQLSRDLDRRHGVQNYVRLCFTTDFPMIHRAIKEGRIREPIVLEFDPKLIFLKETKFCPINATDNYAEIGDSINLFNQINFDIINNNNFIEDPSIRKYKQAEILVLEKVALEYLRKEPYYWRK